MVFGYYTVPIKTVHADQLPAEIPVEAGSHFECGLKLAHIIFIPIFPIEKKWLLKRHGDAYEVTPEAEQLFNTLYGKPKTPWYSFSGLILVAIALLYFAVQDVIKDRKRSAYMKEAKKQIQNEKMKSFENPIASDFYALESAQGQYYGVKVDSTTEDKVWVSYVANDNGYGLNSKNNTVKAFVLANDQFEVQALSKKDLKKSYLKKERLIKIKGLASGQALKVAEVYNVDIDGNKTGIVIQDAETSVAVKNVLNRFVSEASIDSSLTLMDSSSKTYLLNIVKTAQSVKVSNMKALIKKSNNPEANYAMMLYAKYAYLSTLEGKVPDSDKKLLKDFGFFSKLIGLGLWSINSKIKNIRVNMVNVSGKNQASANISLYSNILKTSERISFWVKLKKENGQWKVNLPSTFSYTNKQIDMVGEYNSGPREYREMIRNSLTKFNPNTKFAPELVY